MNTLKKRYIGFISKEEPSPVTFIKDEFTPNKLFEQISLKTKYIQSTSTWTGKKKGTHKTRKTRINSLKRDKVPKLL